MPLAPRLPAPPEMLSTLEETYERVLRRDPGEAEFHQAVHEVLETLGAGTGGTPRVWPPHSWWSA